MLLQLLLLLLLLLQLLLQLLQLLLLLLLQLLLLVFFGRSAVVAVVARQPSPVVLGARRIEGKHVHLRGWYRHRQRR